MNTRTLSGSYLYSLLVVFLSVPSVWENAVAQEEALKLTIKTPEESYYTIDLVPFVIEMTNTSGAPIKLRRAFAGGTGGLKKYFQLAQGSSYMGALNLQGLHSREQFEYDMAPGETLRLSGFMSPSTLTFDVKTRTLPFKTPPPGVMKLKASYVDVIRGGVSTVHSEPITVELKSSKSLPAAARTLFGKKSWHRFVLNDGLGRREDSAAFQKFYASGNLAPQKKILAFMVGRSYQRGYAQSVIGVTRDPRTGVVIVAPRSQPVCNFPAAILAYEGALETKCTYLKAKTYLRLAECYGNLDKGDEKAKVLKALSSLDCDTWILKSLRK